MEYDSEEGTLRVSTDPKVTARMLPVIQDWADLIRDMTKVGAGILEHLVSLQRSVLDILEVRRVGVPKVEEKAEEEGVEEEIEEKAEEETEESPTTP